MGSLLECFDRWCRDRPGDLALWSRAEQRKLSFKVLGEQAEQWQNLLAGDCRPVALAVGNRTAFVEIFIALRRLGVAVVCMDAMGSGGSSALATSRVELCRRLGISRLIRPHLGAEGAQVLGDDLECLETGAEAVEPPPATALVKLTSGSTGTPLAACFNDASLLAGVRQIGEGMEITAADRVLMALPLSHSYGFDNGVLSLLALGTPLVLEPSVFPADILRAAHNAQATFLPLVPPLVRSLAGSRWPAVTSLRRVICAGGVLPPEFAADFRRMTGLHVHNFYGSTETGGISFEPDPGAGDAAGTVGLPLPGVELTLDEVGRVRVNSAANLTGYLGSQGRDCAAGVEPAKGRQVVTGDLGEWTPHGRLRLVGRSADLLNIGGRKIAVVEVESALLGLEGVRDAAVVGVADAMRGDRTVAYVVSERWPLSLASLPSRLRPRELRRLDTLPHNARGKLDRQLLRSMADQANLGSEVS